MTASRTRPERLWHRPFRRSDRRCAAPDGQATRLPALTGGPHRTARPHLPSLRPAGPAPQAPSRLSLPDGTEVLLRPAGPADKTAALAMHARCSPAALRLRYHGPVRDADRYLDHLLDPRHGRSLAVVAPDGRILALGHLMWDDGEAELAVLVEDGWQRRGLGVALLRRLSATARAAGIGTVYALTHAANAGLIAAMRRLAAPLDFSAEGGTLVITASLGAADPVAHAHHPGR
ncbi:acetyltransferase (GNAT) family protein [Streptomyces sp. 1114.5]|uniref:GNAT family N-acetyltransferase n=1 Tax=unclassified Streptomyces TaxID=2593676 RepID=UPI000BC952EB|nr:MULTISPECIES: GNAT family N-acetyltransferase [unclassified Streptomyces]RKT12103.1 acetyltransferase (GNAT) family protein [Streptomyces sp. 1114.5]SOB79877.1 Acetyltransferase (GNAT) family protein [Streptomyces sp. 1331.2]